MLKKLSPPNNEKEITASWIHKDKVYVSIICTTFNHERYIKDALDGFLAQKTTFRYEIVIHDDASTDNTQEIIKSYQEKYPGLIKCILQTENQYSKGVEVVGLAVEQSLGEYVALCEGDDYWIDDGKIEKQLVVLLQNDKLKMSFHCAHEINQITNEQKKIGSYKNKNNVVTVHDIILKSKGMIPTASTMIKRETFFDYINVMNKIPRTTVGDIYVHIISAIPGGAFYIDSPMSVYRANAINSWNADIKKGDEKILRHLESVICSFVELKTIYKEYNGSFEKAIVRRMHYSLLSSIGLSSKKELFNRYNHLMPKLYVYFHKTILNNYDLFLACKPYLKKIKLFFTNFSAITLK